MKIAWGAVVTPDFCKAVIATCKNLGIPDPSYLMACIAFETGETFSPAIKNSAGSGAVGLIQFMPSTAKALGTTTAREPPCSKALTALAMSAWVNLAALRLIPPPP